MASRVLYSDEYDRKIAQGTLAPEAFDYKILCEGGPANEGRLAGK